MADAPRVPMQRRWSVLLILIVIAGAFLRFYGLASRSLWYDEAATLRVAEYVDRSLKILRPDVHHEAPLLPFLVHFWYALVRAVPGVTAGSAACDYLLRLLPCVLGIVGIPLTFMACRSLLKEDETSLMAALFFAISPFQVYYAQELRAYSLYVALSLGALVCLIRALEEDRPWYWVGLATCLVLSTYGHYFSVWNIAAFNLYFAATLKTHRKLVRRWLTCQLVVFVLCVPAIVLASRMNYFLEQATEHWFLRPDLRTAFITFKNFFAGYSPNRVIYEALFLLCGAFLLLGLYTLRKRKDPFLLTAILAFAPIVGNLVVWRLKSYPFYTHRLMIFSAVPCYMLVALGMRSLRRVAFKVVPVVLLAGLTVPCLVDYYSQRLHPDWHHRLGARYKVQSREAAHYIAEHLDEGDFVGHNSHFTLCPFTYYLSAEQRTLAFTEEERRGLLRGLPNELVWERVGFFPVRIESVTETAKRLWLVTSWWEPFDLDPLSKELRGWLDGHCLRKERRPFDGLTVYFYENDPGLRAVAKTCQLADYGDRVVPYYLFPADESGLEAAREWRRHFLAAFPAGLDEQPSLYGVQFDFAVADAGQLPLEGQQSDAAFADEDSDGERKALRLSDTGALLPEGHSVKLDSVDYSLLASDRDGKRAVFASFPLRTSNDFTYRFVVRNASDVRRTLQCRVYESASVVEPLSFNRCDPQSDTWRPTHQYNPSPPPEILNKFAMVARLSNKQTDGEAIYRDVSLNPGHYTVFAWVQEESLKVNQSRGNLRFYITSPIRSCDEPARQVLGVVRGNNPSGITGWTWRRVGAFQCDGEPFRLVVAAHNDDGLDKAYSNIGRVMFVRTLDGEPLSPVEAEQFDATLLPLEEKEYTISSSLGEYATKRIDVEFVDEETRQFRNIFFHVHCEDD